MNQTNIDTTSVPVFILAGGFGTRLTEETTRVPKPMIEIGGIPILIHIMRHYYSYGFNDFIICGGYKSDVIKKYFLDYQYLNHNLDVDARVDPESPAISCYLGATPERWRVRVIDTGEATMTGARIARAMDTIAHEADFDQFAVTYGDGLTNADLNEQLNFHQEGGAIGTLLGVKNLARFGELDINDTKITGFLEKPEDRQGYINGGFFFFQRQFREYLDTSSDCILERDPLVSLAKDSQLQVFQHTGFWYAMDTLRDKHHLEALWGTGEPPWIPQQRAAYLKNSTYIDSSARPG